MGVWVCGGGVDGGQKNHTHTQHTHTHTHTRSICKRAYGFHIIFILSSDEPTDKKCTDDSSQASVPEYSYTR